MEDTIISSRRIASTFGIRHEEIEDCAGGGKERTLPGQSGTRGTRQRDRRRTGGEKEERGLYRGNTGEPISLIIRRERRARLTRALLCASCLLLLAFIYFVYMRFLFTISLATRGGRKKISSHRVTNRFSNYESFCRIYERLFTYEKLSHQNIIENNLLRLPLNLISSKAIQAIFFSSR